MKNSILKRVLSTAVASFLAISSTPFVAKELDSNAAKMLQTSPSHTQETGWYNDYHHEIWQADTPNSSTMTLYDNGGGFSRQKKSDTPVKNVHENCDDECGKNALRCQHDHSCCYVCSVKDNA